MNRFPRRRARRVAGAGLVALLAGLAACYAPSAAGAAITTFALSPQSGPPGTVVHVSGAGCRPGLLGSAQTDFVALSAPTLGLLAHVPVSASGSWSGTFAVPNGALGASASVAAACVSSGLTSLTTIYTPQTFTVTAAPATTPGTSTSSPGSGGTTPGSTPGTNPSEHPGTVFVPDYPSVVVSVPSPDPHVTTNDTGAVGVRPGDTVSPTESHTTSTSGHAPGRVKGSASPGAATLQQADLGSYVGPGDDVGLGWVSWLLLLALVIAAGGATFMIWRARHAREAATDGDAA